jgi:hypothetical protein
MDGVLAEAEGDRARIARARVAVREAGGRLTEQLDAALVALDLGLAGDPRGAARVADSLSLGRGRLSATRLVNSYPGFDVVLRLAAARFTLAVGDTAAALRNLAMFDAWTLNAMSLPLGAFTTFADYERARIAQAQGRTDDAREYYARVVEVYTHPPPAHQAMVRDAREQLARLSGLREPGQRVP